MNYFYIGISQVTIYLTLMILDIHWIAMGFLLFMYLVVQNVNNYYEY
jgi:hypothetical protein